MSRLLLACGIIAMLVGSGSQLVAQVPDAVPAEARLQLAEEQKILADRYAKLEELFLRMSELESTTNPARSSLLQQAAKLSKELSTAQRMGAASELLSRRQYTAAIQEQQASHENLKKLLELLQSENRDKRIRAERAKFEEIIKEIQRLRRIQQSISGRSENVESTKQTAQDQGDLADQADKIAGQLAELAENENDGEASPANGDQRANPSAPKNGDPSQQSQSQPSQSQPSQSQPSQSQPSQSQQSQSQQSQSQQSQSQQSQSQQSQSQQSQSQQSQSQQSQSPQSPSQTDQSQTPPSADNSRGEPDSENQSDRQSPEDGNSQNGRGPDKDQAPSKVPPEEAARKRVRQAEERMREAQSELEKNQRAEAIQQQKEAEKELRAAAEELERILRQLREEEIERSLKSLESRFRRMMEMQKAVLDETERLDQLTGESRARQTEIAANKLSLEERKILVEGQRAMLLLQEEGTSLAFPEAVQQMLGDIEMVADRLAASDVGPVTAGIEQEILSALEEMIDSLTQVQKNREKEKQERQAQQQRQNQQQSENQPLIDRLAELRLVKTLQLRINGRTTRLSSQLKNADDPDGQAQDASLRQQLRELAQRQEKIQQVTRDIVIAAQEENQQ